MALGKRFKLWRQFRAEQWLKRRIPASQELKLGRNNLFILPTRFGWLYLCLVAVLLILGNNYQNNLVLGFGFWLLSVFLCCLWLCHQNLSGLQLRFRAHAFGAVGQALKLELGHNKSAAVPGLEVSLPHWRGQQNSQMQAQTLILQLWPKLRTYQKLGRLRVESRYPLGLFRCWSLLDFGAELWAYPTAQVGPCPLKTQHEGGGAARNSAQAPPEFVGLKPFREGEPRSRLAWKQLAAGRGKQLKDFAAQVPSRSYELSLAALAEYEPEQALAIMTYWVEQLARTHQSFSMQLGSTELAMAKGSEQLKLAHKQLAEYRG